VYLWLARRYEGEGIFVDEMEARAELQACCDKIEAQLALDPMVDFAKRPKGRPRASSKRRSNK